MKVIGFLFTMAIVYFVVPIAFNIHVTILQSAGITMLLYVARFVLTEGITVRAEPQPFHTWRMVSEEEDEREGD